MFLLSRDGYERLAIEAHRIDDVWQWYLLLRSAAIQRRDSSRGNVRLAHDFCEMAEMLRLFLRDAAGETTLREDEYIGGPYREWQRERYGIGNGGMPDRIGLKRLARDFGLDGSYKGFWYVEGDTEFGFFNRLSRGYGFDLDELGIQLINLGGTGKIEQLRKDVRKRLSNPNEVRQTAKALQADEVFTFLTIDDDSGIAEALKEPEVRALFTAGVMKWDGDFEWANFTFTELMDAASRMQSVESDEVSSGDVIKEIKSERTKLDGTGRPKSFGKAFEDAIVRRTGFESFSKGIRWGETLADLVLESQVDRDSERPALVALRRALSMTYADFSLTLERSRPNS